MNTQQLLDKLIGHAMDQESAKFVAVLIRAREILLKKKEKK